MYGKWVKLALDTSLLAFECQLVVGLRLMKLTLGGPAASREANRMVAEKLTAFEEAAVKVATGGTTRSVVKGNRRKVRANGRRLSKRNNEAPDRQGGWATRVAKSTPAPRGDRGR